jgi:hypothetical protein
MLAAAVPSLVVSRTPNNRTPRSGHRSGHVRELCPLWPQWEQRRVISVSSSSGPGRPEGMRGLATATGGNFNGSIVADEGYRAPPAMHRGKPTQRIRKQEARSNIRLSSIETQEGQRKLDSKRTPAIYSILRILNTRCRRTRSYVTRRESQLTRPKRGLN